LFLTPAFICRGQDEQLADIEKGVDNVTAMGKQIQEHLVEDVSVRVGQAREME
jgi:hypothetical protein